ncbi:hypothetical protein BKA66DRAFT_471261 [Pyrenochaeta sp. MPI-SDFR-AT-0127]|nr:hypothetical protein BKA66DRAFT_471261 [Pyrenochaeta sp. MPI-SDFR-AT-0127]
MAQEGNDLSEHEKCISQEPDNETKPKIQCASTATPDPIGTKFSPFDLSKAPTLSCGLPSELWDIVQSAPAKFPPQYFLEVSRDLLENPNKTASYLARAELSYQSFTDATFNPEAKTAEELAGIVKHLRPECRPQLVQGGIEGYALEWTVVRKLIPRNPKLDDALMQTCHLFTSRQEIVITSTNEKSETVKAERYLVIYIPHASSPEEIPFYHPKVRSLAMLYTYLPEYNSSTSTLPSPGTLTIYYSLFPSHPLDNRLSRTALKLLDIIHKHSRGNHAGYKKRVHHDQIIPQKTFQDTYAYLKGKYAKELINGWVEQTPPEKHVFEDLGIAAFIMELWVDMYGSEVNCNDRRTDNSTTDDDPNGKDVEEKWKRARQNFPGFVDIGCGNGLLVYILNAEGWQGWGFDARKRKTWDTFPSQYANKLKELLLVPKILQTDEDARDFTLANAPPSHCGVFEPGTFIISNHADELTPWTPLLGYLSASPFIAIPCCSHDFGGTRFRAPVHANHLTSTPNEKEVKGKQPSAYAGLCSWVCHLTETVGYKVEKEFLRIPSTRNIAVLGRHNDTFNQRSTRQDKGLEEKLDFTSNLVEKEMGGSTTTEQMSRTWMKSGGDLMKPGRGGH